MGSQIGLEAKGVDGGNLGLDGVEGRAADGLVGDDVTTTPRQHSVHGGNAIGGAQISQIKYDSIRRGVAIKKAKLKFMTSHDVINSKI